MLYTHVYSADVTMRHAISNMCILALGWEWFGKNVKKTSTKPSILKHIIEKNMNVKQVSDFNDVWGNLGLEGHVPQITPLQSAKGLFIYITWIDKSNKPHFFAGRTPPAHQSAHPVPEPAAAGCLSVPGIQRTKFKAPKRTTTKYYKYESIYM